MSRWSDQFENHAIHETISQAHKWVSVEFEDIDSEHEAEQRRLIKVLDLMSVVIAGIDSEFFPEAQLTGLNNHLRHPNFWQQLSDYSSNGNVQHLKTANDHINSQVPIIYQMAAMSKQPESRKVIKGVENAFDVFCKKVEQKKTEFDKTAEGKAAEITSLEAQVVKLSESLDTLQTSTDSQISSWQTEFTEAQTKRAEEHSVAQIERGREYDDALRDIITKADNDRVDTTKKHNEAFMKSFEKFVENVKNKTKDINDKHMSILKIHGLVTNDGVAGGYKKGADNEKSAAKWWSIISMVCYGLILLWVLFKGKLGFGIADLEGIDWPVVVTTISVTAVAFFAARFAGKLSRVHRMNEQRMRWFSFEIAAIDPFLSSLPTEMQQELKKELSERLFGQDRVIDDRPSKVQGIDPSTIESITNPITAAIKAFGK